MLYKFNSLIITVTTFIQLFLCPVESDLLFSMSFVHFENHKGVIYGTILKTERVCRPIYSCLSRFTLKSKNRSVKCCDADLCGIKTVLKTNLLILISNYLDISSFL